MPNKPLLTVAIIVQNQRDVVETTLTSVFELSSIPFELFIIDDHSGDGSTDVIDSLLAYYQHEHTFYFTHDSATGRGNALNEAILQSNGQIFWAPNTIAEIDEGTLSMQLEQLANSTNAGMLQQRVLPDNQQQWTDFISRENWPQDGAFLWNLQALSAAEQFFNPYLDHYSGLELALRLRGHKRPFAVSNDQWYRPSNLVPATEPNFKLRQELFFTLLRDLKPSGEQRSNVLSRLRDLHETKEEPKFEHELLNRALQMKRDGRFNSALELIEEVLDEFPGHAGARNLKIEILEKKRRFVEASELKHEVNKSKAKQDRSEEEQEQEPETSNEVPTESDDGDIDISLIVPTTTYGKPALEHCLLSISEHCDTSALELIVIDNASLDDTHDYLNELKEKDFLRCRIITNAQNAGFSASINQGLEKARGRYACIIHNDISVKDDVLSQLRDLMDEHPDYAILGPSTNKTLNPDQATRNVRDSDPELMQAEYLDSFCMMVRMDSDLQMDTDYQLAFFEDIDLCFQARSQGHKVGIAPHITVEHHFGTTTFSLDLDTESDQYWKNVAHFNEKWEIEVFSEEELKSLSTFDQLLALDDLVNPLYPEDEIKKQFERLFTDELKTEILKTQHQDETLCKLVHLFMVMGEREIMRRLEDRLETVDMPASLIYQLVRFYFNRNIYSRCSHYLDKLKPQNESLRADLYRLAILVENKDLDQAIPMLRDLMEHAPANPMLYKLAGDIHRFNGNDEEAGSFYDLAEQINPFEFTNEEKDAFGFQL